MTSRERNDAKRMRKINGGIRFYLDIRDKSEDTLLKARDILLEADASSALLKDALIAYISRPDFNIENYTSGLRK